jgi:glyoxylase-like metal-dependent hydrolase (beta-lactamase superfamily II)
MQLQRPDAFNPTTAGRLSRRAAMKGVGATAALAGGLGRHVAAAQDATPAPLADEVLRFGDDTYAFVSSGYVSLFVATDDGVIGTDPSSQFDAGRAGRYKAAIAGVTDQPVRYLVYSHGHADHATGGDVFADTATFVSHRDAVAGTRGPRRRPHPGADGRLRRLPLARDGRDGGRAAPRRPQPLRQQRRAAAPGGPGPVRGRLHPGRLPALPGSAGRLPEEWIASLRWVEEHLDFETLVPGHPPLPGTKATVGEVRGYLEELIAAVEAAQAEGLADGSAEMVGAVRAELEPAYGGWANFEEWLPLNVEGLLRIWSEQGGHPQVRDARGVAAQ